MIDKDYNFDRFKSKKNKKCCYAKTDLGGSQTELRKPSLKKVSSPESIL